LKGIDNYKIGFLFASVTLGGNDDNKIPAYKGEVESEPRNICDGILRLMETHLIPSSTSDESKVFYLEMKDDYHRYLAELKTGK
jgi:14-3-3 protein epsilon